MCWISKRKGFKKRDVGLGSAKSALWSDYKHINVMLTYTSYKKHTLIARSTASIELQTHNWCLWRRCSRCCVCIDCIAHITRIALSEFDHRTWRRQQKHHHISVFLSFSPLILYVIISLFLVPPAVQLLSVSLVFEVSAALPALLARGPQETQLLIATHSLV